MVDAILREGKKHRHRGVERPCQPAAVQPVKRRQRRPASNAIGWTAYTVRNQVIQGFHKKTKSGLERQDLGYSKHTGKVMSLRRSFASKKQYKGSYLQLWNKCKAKARKLLGLRGFVPVNGASADGKRLYDKTCELVAEELGPL